MAVFWAASGKLLLKRFGNRCIVNLCRPCLFVPLVHHNEFEGFIVALRVEPTRDHGEECRMWRRVAQACGQTVGHAIRAVDVIELLPKRQFDGIGAHRIGRVDHLRGVRARERCLNGLFAGASSSPPPLIERYDFRRLRTPEMIAPTRSVACLNGSSNKCA